MDSASSIQGGGSGSGIAAMWGDGMARVGAAPGIGIGGDARASR